jgi:wobble nucleotide-excising tRNase
VNTLKIEKQASEESKQWSDAINLYNQRFIDMPYSLGIVNVAGITLAGEAPNLVYKFKDGENVRNTNAEGVLKLNLSKGEKRAFYLLNFIFEVERRKKEKQLTLFVLDDPADSFDYKNKIAIIQYLKDIAEEEFFYQIILTHNFDLFRTLSFSFIHYNRFLGANKSSEEISLEKVDGIKNIFILSWKPKINDDKRILIACIPFVRNIVEYTQGENDTFKTLTSMLHWKSNSEKLTVRDFMKIFKQMFNGDIVEKEYLDDPIVEFIFSESDKVGTQVVSQGFDLERKIVLSIAIRLKAEQFMLNKLKEYHKDSNYWINKENQFRKLSDEYKKCIGDEKVVEIINKVSLTVSSNIHLNSFMYEPILDLSMDRLVKLYKEVSNLDEGD